MTQSETSKQFMQQLKELENKVMNEINAIDIYLPCDDNSGEIYNRKTGQRYRVQLVNKIEKPKGDPFKSIGSFKTSASVTNSKKSNIGKWNK